jgi:hypothetical protein
MEREDAQYDLFEQGGGARTHEGPIDPQERTSQVSCEHKSLLCPQPGAIVCARCGEVLSHAEPKPQVEGRDDDANYEVVDRGVVEQIIRHPFFECVPKMVVRDRHHKEYRYIGPASDEVDESDSTNEYELEEEEILF